MGKIVAARTDFRFSVLNVTVWYGTQRFKSFPGTRTHIYTPEHPNIHHVSDVCVLYNFSDEYAVEDGHCFKFYLSCLGGCLA